jgi:hypothetical protein
MTFADGVLGDQSSVKGFEVVATDGRAGRISWATYAPGDSYLAVTVGRVKHTHHVLPAGAVRSVRDGEVHIALTRSDIERLPLLADVQAPVDQKQVQQAIATFENAAGTWPAPF